MKLKHISAALAVAALLPFAASALTTEDIQQQITALLAQIAQLQQQLKQLQVPDQRACTMEAKICPDGTAVGRTGPNCEFAACPGAGAPPSRICPQILRTLAQGATGDDVTQLQQYLGVSTTGYFGPVTARAVAAAQADAGLEQVGIVGPQTRAWIYRRCGGGGTVINDTFFSAVPTSGPAPLSVTFRTNVVNDLDSYSIEFGDGTNGPLQNNCLLGYGACGLPTATHTYTANGTYSAKLTKKTVCGMTNSMPGSQIHCPTTVGTVTIYVGGTTGAGAPVVTGVDGPAALNVGQTGTWTVRATVPNNANTNLRYSVVWGDEGVFDQIRGFGGIAAPALATSGTFTHAYQSAGTFRPTFAVANDAGSAQTSASVTVSGSTSVADFSASPTSGPAPLNVNFQASNTDGISRYSVNFGDGSSADMMPGPMPMMACPIDIDGGGCGNWKSYLAAYHTYTSAGTYTATLYRDNCPKGAYCFAGPLPVGTVSITVSPAPTNAGYLNVTPRSGPAPLTVTVTTSNLPSGAGLDFGDSSGSGAVACGVTANTTTSSGNAVPQSTTPVWLPCNFTGTTHTYANPGTYIVRVSGANGTIDTVTVTVSGIANTCGDGGCGYWVPPSTYPTTGAPTPAPQSSVSTSNASPSAIYWCGDGAVSNVQSTPCATAR
ncbi:PKD domain-containing protein [Candidatus Kaiserbacteria bacterium]|nr:PKD domain-containing protein [Candidatus Kaiserbacteria bacterium]